MTAASRDRLLAGGFALLLFLALAASQSASVADYRQLLWALTVAPIAAIHLLFGMAAICAQGVGVCALGRRTILLLSFLLSATITAACLLIACAILDVVPAALPREVAQFVAAASLATAILLGWFALRRHLSDMPR